MKVEMIYLSQEDVIRCGGMSMDKAIDRSGRGLPPL